MTTLLVDGDILVYLIGLRNQVVESFPHADSGAEVYHVYAHEEKALADMDRTLEEFQERVGARHLRVALSDPERDRNWRRAVDPGYKANRGGQRPVIFYRLRDHLRDAHGAQWWESLEGDDVLGIWGTHPEYRDTIIASTDKDLRTVPGRHYNWDRHADGVITIPPDLADWNHLRQTLMGDRTDNYSGCPGMGPVGATKHLKKHGLSWDAVVAAFERKGLTADDALRNAQVARILRHGEYDKDTHKVTLWTPS